MTSLTLPLALAPAWPLSQSRLSSPNVTEIARFIVNSISYKYTYDTRPLG